MQTEIIFAGFGGQGVLFAGQMTAYAAMDQGKEVTWFPSYGPEMRGGTANCTVIVADEEIGAVVVRNPQAAVVMNLPSLDKYEPLLKPGGLLVINSSLIERPVARKDLRVVLVPANEIAESLGDRRMANMVVMGALLSNLGLFNLQEMEKTFKAHLPAKLQKLLAQNLKAFEEGASHKV